MKAALAAALDSIRQPVKKNAGHPLRFFSLIIESTAQGYLNHQYQRTPQEYCVRRSKRNRRLCKGMRNQNTVLN